MIRWLRVVLPAPWVLLVFLVYFDFAATAVLYLEWRFGWVVPDARIAFTLVPTFMALLSYALYRVVAFHPLFRPDYHDWLATTPWNSQRPLPLGPIHLVWQDFVLVGLLMCVTWPTCAPWVEAFPQAFLLTYLIALTTGLFLSGEWLFGYVVWFGIGAVIRLWSETPACLGVALATYGVAILGLGQSFRRFPWDTSWLKTLKQQLAAGKQGADRNANMGWPFARLSPKVPEFRIPLHHAALISALVGWCLYAGAAHLPEHLAKDFGGLLLLPGFLAPLGRLIGYIDGYLPPISLYGRLATGRWIIPGYDQVFAAPLLALIAGVSCLTVCVQNGIAPAVYGPLAFAVILFIVLGGGPSYSRWRLTGNHRIWEGGKRTMCVKVG